MICSVRHCRYIADATIEDFGVCALHDHAATRRILEQLRAPAAFVTPEGHPIVLPVGPLTERDLVPCPDYVGALHAWECPRVAATPSGPAFAHPNFDLTR